MLLARTSFVGPLAARPSNVCTTTARVFAAHRRHRLDLGTTPPSASLTIAAASQQAEAREEVEIEGVHHVGFLTEDLQQSLAFYEGVLGLKTNPDRPDERLPYGGRWLWIGPEMIHLMELPNPDPLEGRPDHGGRDRHVCIGLKSVAPLEARLEAAGVPYTRSKSGRAAIFFRDPDQNTLECVETEAWR